MTETLNITPETWGPYWWGVIHLTTLSYPAMPTQEDKNAIRTFVETISKVLPCLNCRQNFNEHIKKIPLTDEILATNTTLIQWGIDMHNEVNKMLGKPSITISDVIDIYIKKNKYNKNPSDNGKINALILVQCIIIIIMIVYIIRNRRMI